MVGVDCDLLISTVWFVLALLPVVKGGGLLIVLVIYVLRTYTLSFLAGLI